MDKKEFLKLYEKVKKEEVNINTLDEETIRRIFMIAEEEININNRIINEKLEQLKASLDNSKNTIKKLQNS